MELPCSELAPVLPLRPLQLAMPLREQEGRQGGGIYTAGIGKNAGQGISTGSIRMNKLLTEPWTGLQHLHDFSKTHQISRETGK